MMEHPNMYIHTSKCTCTYEEIMSKILQYQNTCTQRGRERKRGGREREKERLHTFIFNILDYKSICSCFKTASPTLSNNTKPLFIRLSHIIKHKNVIFTVIY